MYCRYLALESMSLLATSEFSHEAVKKHQETVITSLKVNVQSHSLSTSMINHDNLSSCRTQKLFPKRFGLDTFHCIISTNLYWFSAGFLYQ